MDEQKEQERKKTVLDTAEKLKITVATEGWEYMMAYVLVRVRSLKNKLANINLSEKLSDAIKSQGIIEGLNNFVYKVNNVMQEAEKIKKESKEKK